MPGEDLGEIDVGRLDRVGAGRERDVLESVRRSDRVDLGMEDAPLGRGRIRDVRRSPSDRSRGPPVPPHGGLPWSSRVYQRPRSPEGCVTASTRGPRRRASARTRRPAPGRTGRRGSARWRSDSPARRPRDGPRRAAASGRSSCSWERRGSRVRDDADGEDRGRRDHGVDRRLVELVDEVEVVERLDVRAVEAGLLARAREGRRRRLARRPRASRTRTARGPAGCGPARGGSAGSPGRAGAVAVDPAVDEVGPEGAHDAAPIRRAQIVQLLEVHQVVNAGEHQPLAAAKLADLRMVQAGRARSRARRRSVPRVR